MKLTLADLDPLDQEIARLIAYEALSNVELTRRIGRCQSTVRNRLAASYDQLECPARGSSKRVWLLRWVWEQEPPA